MQIYLVGGAVRDSLLGLPLKEKDWVVVGGTPEEMTQRGFLPVGKDFPVFLHPETHEEYALARTERKTGKGYKGFLFHASPAVTLEEDLRRRDLTVNAMAQTKNGQLIDPFGGKKDLEKRILRHVSPAFVEDPVRCLRVARFAARFSHLGFKIAEETEALMQKMVASGEVNALVPERVWKELECGLSEQHPHVFFQVLKNCGALKVLFPEIDSLFGVPNPLKHHPEIDTGVHTLLVLEQAAPLTQDPKVRFAALLHDLGKALTPSAAWPKHYAHETLGLNPIRALCTRTKAPKAYLELALLVAKYHLICHQVEKLKPTTLHDFLMKLDVLRRPHRFFGFLIACEADARGRWGFEEAPYPQRAFLKKAYEVIRKVGSIDTSKKLSGSEYGEQLRRLRIQALKKELYL